MSRHFTSFCCHLCAALLYSLVLFGLLRMRVPGPRPAAPCPRVCGGKREARASKLWRREGEREVADSMTWESCLLPRGASNQTRRRRERFEEAVAIEGMRNGATGRVVDGYKYGLPWCALIRGILLYNAGAVVTQSLLVWLCVRVVSQLVSRITFDPCRNVQPLSATSSTPTTSLSSLTAPPASLGAGPGPPPPPPPLPGPPFSRAWWGS